MSLPTLKATATLDVSEFLQGAAQIKRAIGDLQKMPKTIQLTVQLVGGKEKEAVQAVQALNQAIAAAGQPMTDMQRRIAAMFSEYERGSARAAQSANVFKAEQEAVRAQIQQLSNAVAIQRLQADRTVISHQDSQRTVAELARLDEALKKIGATARTTFGDTSNEAKRVEQALRQSAATAAQVQGEFTKLGLAANVQMGTTAGLLEWGNQLRGTVVSLAAFASAANAAQVASGLFDKQLQNIGLSSVEVRTQLDELATQYGAVSAVMEDTARVLMRNGYTFEQARKLMEGYAASALASGKSVNEAMDALGSDITTSTTVRSNAMGIQANIISSWQSYAASVGKTKDELTATEKAQAFTNAVIRETAGEVEQAQSLMSGYAGEQARLNTELRNLQTVVGETVLPLFETGARTLRVFLEGFNELSPKVQQFSLVGAAAAVLFVRNWDAIRNLPDNLVAFNTMLVTTGQKIAAFIASQRMQMLMTTSVSAAMKTSVITMKGYMAAQMAATGTTNVFSAAVVRLNTTLVALRATTLGFASAAASFAALVVPLLAGVTAAAALNHQFSKLAKSYDELEKNNQARNDATMQRVRHLKEEGTEAARARAKLLLLQQQRANASSGVVTGSKWFGEPIVQQDLALVQKLNKEIAAQRQKVIELTNAANARNKALGKTVELTKEEREERERVTQEVRAAISSEETRLQRAGLSELQGELAEIDDRLLGMREKLREAFTLEDGTLHSTQEYLALLGRIQALGISAKAAARDEAAKKAAETAADAAKEAQRAEIEALVDGAEKRRQLRALEIDELQKDAAETAKGLSEFPDARARFEAATQQKIAAMRRNWANEDAAAAREAAERRLEEERKVEEERLEEIKRIGELVRNARREARDAEIAAISDDGMRTQAERAATREDEALEWQARLDEVERGSVAYVAIREAWQRKVAALERKWANEDAVAARETARKIAAAWDAAADAVGEAKIAALQKRQAQQELELSRQIERAGGADTVAGASLRLRAVQQDAVLADQLLQEQQRNQRRNLEQQHRERVSQEGLTASEIEALRRQHLAALSHLEHQTATTALENKKRFEEQERQALQDLLEARQKAAREPVEAAEKQREVIQRRLELVKTEQDYQQVQAALNGNLAQQINLNQNLLAQADSLQLTAEQRAEIEASIAKLQHDQVLAAKEQEQRQKRILDMQRAVRDEQDNLDMRRARTTEERLGVLNRQLQHAEADRLVALAEMQKGTDEERLAAQQELLAVQGRIVQLQEELGSLLDDEAAQRRALADYQYDLAEARMRAEAQIRGLGDDAVYQARMNLALVEQSIKRTTEALRGAEGEEARRLQMDLVQATGEQAAAQRELTEALRDREAAVKEAKEGLAALARASEVMMPVQARTADLIEARRKLSEAEVEYQRVSGSGHVAHQAAAIQGLTEAITGQRAALAQVAAAYREIISQGDAVRGLTERLGRAVYGDAGREFNAARERERFKAIQQRRDEAAADLRRALDTGDRAAITASAEQLTALQERLAAQIKMMEEAGAIASDSGLREVRGLLEMLDSYTITADKEALILSQRAEIAEREAAAIYEFGRHVSKFANVRFEDVLPRLDMVQVAQVSERVIVGEMTKRMSAALAPIVLQQQSSMPAVQHQDRVTVNASINISGAGDPQQVALAVRDYVERIRQNAAREKKFEGHCPR